MFVYTVYGVPVTGWQKSSAVERVSPSNRTRRIARSPEVSSFARGNPVEEHRQSYVQPIEQPGTAQRRNLRSDISAMPITGMQSTVLELRKPLPTGNGEYIQKYIQGLHEIHTAYIVKKQARAQGSFEEALPQTVSTL